MERSGGAKCVDATRSQRRVCILSAALAARKNLLVPPCRALPITGRICDRFQLTPKARAQPQRSTPRTSAAMRAWQRLIVLAALLGAAAAASRDLEAREGVFVG